MVESLLEEGFYNQLGGNLDYLVDYLNTKSIPKSNKKYLQEIYDQGKKQEKLGASLEDNAKELASSIPKEYQTQVPDIISKCLEFLSDEYFSYENRPVEIRTQKILRDLKDNFKEDEWEFLEKIFTNYKTSL